MVIIKVYNNSNNFYNNFFHLRLWEMLCHCYGPETNHNRSSLLCLLMDINYEDSEKIFPGCSQCSPQSSIVSIFTLPRKDCLPRKGVMWLWCPSWLFVDVLCHISSSIWKDAKAWKRQRALLLRELNANSWFHLGWRLKFHYVLYKLKSFRNNI